jgi:hypothetical protein
MSVTTVARVGALARRTTSASRGIRVLLRVRQLVA